MKKDKMTNNNNQNGLRKIGEPTPQAADSNPNPCCRAHCSG